MKVTAVMHTVKVARVSKMVPDRDDVTVKSYYYENVIHVYQISLFP